MRGKVGRNELTQYFTFLPIERASVIVYSAGFIVEDTVHQDSCSSLSSTISFSSWSSSAVFLALQILPRLITCMFEVKVCHRYLVFSCLEDIRLVVEKWVGFPGSSKQNVALHPFRGDSCHKAPENPNNSSKFIQCHLFACFTSLLHTSIEPTNYTSSSHQP